METKKFTDHQRLQCFEALQILGSMPNTMHRNVESQQLGHCMMDDYSDINIQDDALENLLLILNVFYEPEISLLSIFDKLDGLKSIPPNHSERISEFLDGILLAKEIPNGLRYVNQLLKYLHKPSFNEAFEMVANGAKISPPSVGKYHIGISYHSHHCEDPLENGGPDLLFDNHISEYDSLQDLLEDAETPVNTMLSAISKNLVKNDEGVFNLISVRILKGGVVLIDFPINESVYGWACPTFSFEERVSTADIVIGDKILAELHGIHPSTPAKNRIKGRLVEQDLGM